MGLAIVAAASPFFSGYYDFEVWGVLAIVSLAILAAILSAKPARPPWPVGLVVGALLFLAAWSAMSMVWADSKDAAWTETNRLLLYSTITLIGGLSVRTIAGARLVLIVLTTGIALVALVSLGRVLLTDESAFLTGRLNSPVDYINGMAAVLLMGVWPLMAAAERLRPAAAGACLGLTTVEVGLLVLTQARAAIPAAVLTTIVALLVIPGRARRVWALLLVGLGVAIGLHWTLAPYAQQDFQTGAIPPATLRGAGLAVAISGLAVGGLWVLIRLSTRRLSGHRWKRLLTTSSVAVVLAVLVFGAVITGDPVARLRSGWASFTSLRVNARAPVRFTDVGGHRYDLWRVALKEAEAHPLTGVGAGSYGLRYMALRRNSEAVRQPHSLELQMLAELGIPGLALLLVVVAGIAAASFLLRKRAPATALGILGLFGVWLVDTSVDWTYDLPGISAIAFLAAAAALGATTPKSRLRPARPPRAHRLALIGALLITAVAAISVGRKYVATRYLDAARSALARGSAITALADTRASLTLAGSNVDALYIRAAVFARLDDFADSRTTLLSAAAAEPENYVPWALLGDLYSRRGDLGEARTAYSQASRLNPLEPDLSALAARQPVS